MRHERLTNQLMEPSSGATILQEGRVRWCCMQVTTICCWQSGQQSRSSYLPRLLRQHPHALVALP